MPLLGRRGNKVEYKCSVCNGIFFDEEEDDIGKDKSYSKEKQRGKAQLTKGSNIPYQD
jgi:hypothetical protein